MCICPPYWLNVHLFTILLPSGKASDSTKLKGRTQNCRLRMHMQGWTRVGTLLPIIGHRSNASTVAEPSSDGSSLRASFNRQALDPDATSPARQALIGGSGNQREAPQHCIVWHMQHAMLMRRRGCQCLGACNYSERALLPPLVM